MTLREKQEIFALNVAHLIVYIFTYQNGIYTCTIGEVQRPAEWAAILHAKGVGILKSVHIIQLAVDLNLFKNGVYQEDSEAHRPFGDFWKSRHPLNRWGGDFRTRKDGNHYSMEHGGRK